MTRRCIDRRSGADHESVSHRKETSDQRRAAESLGERRLNQFRRRPVVAREFAGVSSFFQACGIVLSLSLSTAKAAAAPEHARTDGRLRLAYVGFWCGKVFLRSRGGGVTEVDSLAPECTLGVGGGCRWQCRTDSKMRTWEGGLSSSITGAGEDAPRLSVVSVYPL